MRLLDILFKPAECWRMGLGFIGRKLGFGAKSRRLAEQQATINQLRFQLHEADKELAEVRSQRDDLKSKFTKEELESKLRLATESINDIKGKLDTALDEHYKKPILKISEKDALIKSLRAEVAAEKARYEAIKSELEMEKAENRKQRNATAQMWKFIHTRHRLNMTPANGSIEQILRQQR